VKWDRGELRDLYYELRESVSSPTLRTFFYFLVSRGVIPNTRSAYKRLSKVCVEMRKQGLIPWDAFVDKTRVTRGWFEDSRLGDDYPKRVEERLERKLESLNIDELLADYFDVYIPSLGRWAGQKHYVEVWIEKEALADHVYECIADLDVKLRVNRGYSSWTFIYDNARELREYRDRDIVVLYLGDLDPSGVDIERFVREATEYFNVDFKLVRVAVTEEQVEKYNLPPRPEDAETLAKLHRDPRTRKYTKKYVVELDALVAYVPEEFKRIVREAVNSYWDESVFEKEKERHKEIVEECRKLINEYIKKAKERMSHDSNEDEDSDETGSESD